MILHEINNRFKKQGLKKAENEAHDWFSTAKKNPMDPTVVFVESQMLQVVQQIQSYRSSINNSKRQKVD